MPTDPSYELRDIHLRSALDSEQANVMIDTDRLLGPERDAEMSGNSKRLLLLLGVSFVLFDCINNGTPAL